MDGLAVNRAQLDFGGYAIYQDSMGQSIITAIYFDSLKHKAIP